MNLFKLQTVQAPLLFNSVKLLKQIAKHKTQYKIYNMKKKNDGNVKTTSMFYAPPFFQM